MENKPEVKNCPDCEKPLKFVIRLDTDRWGQLDYYYCKNCKETFVSQRGNELAIAADKYTGK